jgi:hypothetical protein
MELVTLTREQKSCTRSSCTPLQAVLLLPLVAIRPFLQLQSSKGHHVCRVAAATGGNSAIFAAAEQQRAHGNMMR